LLVLAGLRLPWLEADSGNAGFWTYAYFVSDEGEYTAGGRLHYLTGSFVDALLGEPHTFTTSPLMHFTAAWGYRIMGLSYGAARLPTMIAAMVGWLAIYWMTSRRTAPWLACLLVALLSSNPLSLTYERTASSDIMCGSLIILAILCLDIACAGRVMFNGIRHPGESRDPVHAASKFAIRNTLLPLLLFLSGIFFALSFFAKLTALAFVPMLLLLLGCIACSPGGHRAFGAGTKEWPGLDLAGDSSRAFGMTEFEDAPTERRAPFGQPQDFGAAPSSFRHSDESRHGVDKNRESVDSSFKSPIAQSSVRNSLLPLFLFLLGFFVAFIPLQFIVSEIAIPLRTLESSAGVATDSVFTFLSFQPMQWLSALSIFPRWPVAAQLGFLILPILVVPLFVLCGGLWRRSLSRFDTLLLLGLLIFVLLAGTQKLGAVRYLLPAVFFSPLVLAVLHQVIQSSLSHSGLSSMAVAEGGKGRNPVADDPFSPSSAKSAISNPGAATLLPILVPGLLLLSFWFPLFIPFAKLGELNHGEFFVPQSPSWLHNGYWILFWSLVLFFLLRKHWPSSFLFCRAEAMANEDQEGGRGEYPRSSAPFRGVCWGEVGSKGLLFLLLILVALVFANWNLAVLEIHGVVEQQEFLAQQGFMKDQLLYQVRLVVVFSILIFCHGFFQRGGSFVGTFGWAGWIPKGLILFFLLLYSAELFLNPIWRKGVAGLAERTYLMSAMASDFSRELKIGESGDSSMPVVIGARSATWLRNTNLRLGYGACNAREKAFVDWLVDLVKSEEGRRDVLWVVESDWSPQLDYFLKYNGGRLRAEKGPEFSLLSTAAPKLIPVKVYRLTSS
jgi:hypothetical protein